LFRPMSEGNPIEAAALRLREAITALNVAAKRKELTDSTVESLHEEIQAISEDRSRLAQELDALKNRAVKLEQVNEEISDKLEHAIVALEETIVEAERG
jgi:predicted nuclease with TOPRIM domain